MGERKMSTKAPEITMKFLLHRGWFSNFASILARMIEQTVKY